MAEPKPKRRTRERILEAALRLFNEEGVPNVTTADIADELEISPGNLYYHFRNKDEIIHALFETFEKRMDEQLVVPEERAPDVEDLWFMLHLVFETMAQYRFLYRDLEQIVSHDHKLAAHFGRIVEHGTQVVKALCQAMVKSGSMHASPREIEAVGQNVALVTTYWISFQRVRQSARAARRGTTAAGGGELDHGAYQVLALIAPYLLGPARALLDRLGQQYLAPAGAAMQR
jgi:AcrR family transcriptional regulator